MAAVDVDRCHIHDASARNLSRLRCYRYGHYLQKVGRHLTACVLLCQVFGSVCGLRHIRSFSVRATEWGRALSSVAVGSLEHSKKSTEKKGGGCEISSVCGNGCRNLQHLRHVSGFYYCRCVFSSDDASFSCRGGVLIVRILLQLQVTRSAGCGVYREDRNYARFPSGGSWLRLGVVLSGGI